MPDRPCQGSINIYPAIKTSSQTHGQPGCRVCEGDSRGQETAMERVLGIAGFYFRASDPGALARWYDSCLGVDLNLLGPSALGLHPGGIKAPLQPDDLGSLQADGGSGWILNFRVRDLDQMVRQLRSHGVTVDVDPRAHSVGRLARFADPEGNPLAIWETQLMDARE